jgi:hypothetical protein
MCTPDVAKALNPITAAVTGAVSGLFGSMQQPATPAPTAGAAPESQAAKAPDEGAMRRAAAALAGPSVQSTMLTGPGGVSPSLLNIGKTTLLGG